jgi:DNA-binding transcriptional MerR regulator
VQGSLQEAALNKAPDAFRTISEVADELDLPQHVLRFWESRFPHVRPMKRGGGRRYYRPEDIDLLRGIRHLLYGDGYTIRGVQRILREQGVRTVQSMGQGHPVSLPVLARDDAQGDDAQGEDGEPNSAPGVLRFRSGPSSGPSEENGGEVREQEPDDSEPSEFVPQKRPMAEANSVAVPAAPKEPEDVRQAPPPVAEPPSKGLAAEDLARLRSALAGLEACRRLLDKANEGGR